MGRGVYSVAPLPPRQQKEWGQRLGQYGQRPTLLRAHPRGMRDGEFLLQRCGPANEYRTSAKEGPFVGDAVLARAGILELAFAGPSWAQ